MDRPRTPPQVPPSWSRSDRALLVALVLALGALFALRAATRRPDESRLPRRPDLVVLHVAELRADALGTADLAADLGVDPAATLRFTEAFAQSTDPLRSALSALSGDLVLNLERQPGPASLAPRLAAAGWRTLLLGPQALVDVAGADFEAARALDPAAQPDALAAALGSAPPEPVFAFVHLQLPGPPLHGQTTEAGALHRAYAQRLAAVRTVLRDLAAASYRDRPQILVVLGASGAELGEHPGDPEHLHDTRLHVPFVLALRGGTGLPTGAQGALVQSADLAPTLLDLVDAPLPGTGDGASLEALVHGWTDRAPHDSLFLAGPGEVALRSAAWKLLVPVDAPWRPRRPEARLFALDEDPGEFRDLAAEHPLGAVGATMYADLAARLERPEPRPERGLPEAGGRRR